MKKILPIILLLVFSTGVYAQEISKVTDLKKREAASAEVPPAVDREIRTDQEFVDVFNWLMETPIHQDSDTRQLVNAAISNYIEQNPKFDIELDVQLFKFADSSPELLTVFMGGYTTYLIENPNADPLKANVAGVESVIEYYKKNEKFLEKDKNVEKFIRKAEKEKLEKFIERKTN